jgi:hypothetical protein
MLSMIQTVNTDTSQLANTDTCQSVITDLNNQDLLNVTSISSTNNVYSMLPDSQNSLKVYYQNICGLKYKTNELLSFFIPRLSPQYLFNWTPLESIWVR